VVAPPVPALVDVDPVEDSLPPQARSVREEKPRAQKRMDRMGGF